MKALCGDAVDLGEGDGAVGGHIRRDSGWFSRRFGFFPCYTPKALSDNRLLCVTVSGGQEQ